ncbi:NAD(P)/FAD-dependent oxidoreductase [Symbioplanes lichenis]|uniref:NAD(P)/FAD-dependent oxidoreductase n=1 Tax=Symbioplanes lichenis TaxID=1629072 RepID=UPI0027399CC3|nr:NAD(P)/FAD-dependent oxidoreductase [Actinoplanes lichenis]
MSENRHRVVIVGAGFGGLYAARALRKAPVDVTVINGTNHHVFEPLIYQVAAGVLSPGEVATPVRYALRRQRNAEVRLGWVTGVDTTARTVTAAVPGGGSYQVRYDTLIVAAGATGSYFGHDGYAAHAPGLKSIGDALDIRARVFGAFERAELDPGAGAPAFVVVGAGPTGVELAGQIAEISRRALRGQFRHFDPADARVILLDAADRVLPTFAPATSAKAARRLRKLGVDVRLDTRVVDLDATGVKVDTTAGAEHIDATTKIWAAGVAGTSLARRLAEDTGAPTDRAGRILVDPDLTVPGHPEIFVLGEAMSRDGLPGVAQVAMQGGTYAGRTITRRLTGRPNGKPFHYFDKGNMAAVSRYFAVADIGPLHLGGFVGWLAWLGVHLFYLRGRRNKATVAFRQLVSFVGRDRSESAV